MDGGDIELVSCEKGVLKVFLLLRILHVLVHVFPSGYVFVSA